MWVSDEAQGYVPAVVSATATAGNVELRLLLVGGDGTAPEDLASLPSLSVSAAKKAPTASGPARAATASSSGGSSTVSKFGAASKFGSSTSGSASGNKVGTSAAAAKDTAPAATAQDVQQPRLYKRAAIDHSSGNSISAAPASEQSLLDVFRPRASSSSAQPSSVACGPYAISVGTEGGQTAGRAAAAAGVSALAAPRRGATDGLIVEAPNLVASDAGTASASLPSSSSAATIISFGEGSGYASSTATVKAVLASHGSDASAYQSVMAAIAPFAQVDGELRAVSCTSFTLSPGNAVTSLKLQLAGLDYSRACCHSANASEQAFDALRLYGATTAQASTDGGTTWASLSTTLGAVLGCTPGDIASYEAAFTAINQLCAISYGGAGIKDDATCDLTEEACDTLAAVGGTLGCSDEKVWELLTANGSASVRQAKANAIDVAAAIYSGVVDSILSMAQAKLQQAYGSFEDCSSKVIRVVALPAAAGWSSPSPLSSASQLAFNTADDMAIAAMTNVAAVFAASDEIGTSAKAMLPLQLATVAVDATVFGSAAGSTPSLLTAVAACSASDTAVDKLVASVGASLAGSAAAKSVSAQPAAQQVVLAHVRGRVAYQPAAVAGVLARSLPAHLSDLLVAKGLATPGTAAPRQHALQEVLSLFSAAVTEGSPSLVWVLNLAAAPTPDAAFHPAHVLQQLRASGIIGCLRIHARGYSTVIPQTMLLRRYPLAMTMGSRKQVASAASSAAKLASSSSSPSLAALSLLTHSLPAPDSASPADSFVPEVRAVMAKLMPAASGDDGLDSSMMAGAVPGGEGRAASQAPYLLTATGVLLRPGALAAMDAAARSTYKQTATTLARKLRAHLAARRDRKRYTRYLRAVRATQRGFRVRAQRRAYIKMRDEHRRAMQLLALSRQLDAHQAVLTGIIEHGRQQHDGCALADVRVHQKVDIAPLRHGLAATAVAGTDVEEARAAVDAYASAIHDVKEAIAAVIAKKEREISERAAAVGLLADAADAVSGALAHGISSGMVLHSKLFEPVHSMPDVIDTARVKAAFDAPSLAAPPAEVLNHLLSTESQMALLSAISCLATAVGVVSGPDWERYRTTIEAAMAAAVRADRIIALEAVRRSAIAEQKQQAEAELQAVVKAMNGVREAAVEAGVVTWPSVVAALHNAAQRISSAGLRINVLASSLFNREDITLAIVDQAPPQGDSAAPAESADGSQQDEMARLRAAVTTGVLSQYLEAVHAASDAVGAAEREIGLQREVNHSEAEAYEKWVGAIVTATSHLSSVWAEALAGDASSNAAAGAIVVPDLKSPDAAMSTEPIASAISAILAAPVRTAIAAAADAVLLAQSARRTAEEQRSRMRPSLASSTSASSSPASPAKQPSSVAVASGMDIFALQSAAEAAVTAAAEADSVHRGETKRRAAATAIRAEAASVLTQAAAELSSALAAAEANGVAPIPSVAAAYQSCCDDLASARALVSSPDPFIDADLGRARAGSVRSAVQAFTLLVTREHERQIEYRAAHAACRRQVDGLLDRLTRMQSAVEAGSLKEEAGVVPALDAAAVAVRHAVGSVIGQLSHPALPPADPTSSSLAVVLLDAQLLHDAVQSAAHVVDASEEAISRARAGRTAREGARARGLQELSLAGSRIDAVKMSARLLGLDGEAVLTSAIGAAEAAVAGASPCLHNTARTSAANPSYLDMAPADITAAVDTATMHVTACELALESLKSARQEADRVRSEAAASDRQRREAEEAAMASRLEVDRSARTQLLELLDQLEARLTEVVRIKEVHSLRDCAVIRRAIKAAEAVVEVANKTCVDATSGVPVAAAAVSAVDIQVSECERLASQLVTGRNGALDRLALVKSSWSAIAACDEKHKQMISLAAATAAAVAASKLVTVDEEAVAGDAQAVVGGATQWDVAAGDAVVAGAEASAQPVAGSLPAFITMADPEVTSDASLFALPTAVSVGSGTAGNNHGSNRSLSTDELSFAREVVVRMAGERPELAVPLAGSDIHLDGSTSPASAGASRNAKKDEVVLTAAEVAAAIAKANLTLPPLGSKIDQHDRARTVAAAIADAKERKRALLSAARWLPAEPAAAFLRQANEAARDAAFQTSTTGIAVEPTYPLPPLVKVALFSSAEAIKAAKGHVSEHLRCLEAFDAVHGLGLGVELGMVMAVVGQDVRAMAEEVAAAGNDDGKSVNDAVYDVDSCIPSVSSAPALRRVVATAVSATDSAWRTTEHVKGQAEARTREVVSVRRRKIAVVKALDVLRVYGKRLATVRAEVEHACKTGDLEGAEAAVLASIDAAVEAGAYANSQVTAMSAYPALQDEAASRINTASPEANGSSTTGDAVVGVIVKAVRSYVESARHARDVFEAELTRCRAVLSRERSMEPHSLGEYEQSAATSQQHHHLQPPRVNSHPTQPGPGDGHNAGHHVEAGTAAPPALIALASVHSSPVAHDIGRREQQQLSDAQLAVPRSRSSSRRASVQHGHASVVQQPSTPPAPPAHDPARRSSTSKSPSRRGSVHHQHHHQSSDLASKVALLHQVQAARDQSVALAQSREDATVRAAEHSQQHPHAHVQFQAALSPSSSLQSTPARPVTRPPTAICAVSLPAEPALPTATRMQLDSSKHRASDNDDNGPSTADFMRAIRGLNMMASQPGGGSLPFSLRTPPAAAVAVARAAPLAGAGVARSLPRTSSPSIHVASPVLRQHPPRVSANGGTGYSTAGEALTGWKAGLRSSSGPYPSAARPFTTHGLGKATSSATASASPRRQ